MTISPAVLDAMLAAGCSAEQIVAAVKADLAETEVKREAKRANNAERQQRFRDRRKGKKEARNTNNASNALRGVTPPIERIHTPQSDFSPDGEKQTAARKKRAEPSRPADVSPQVWSDFLAMRRRMRADVSETVISGFRREADRVGWPLEQAISECVVRNWRGFKAKWVQDNDRRSQENRGFCQQGPDRRSSLARAIDEGLEWLDAQ